MDQAVAVKRKQTDEREEESDKKIFKIEEVAGECYLTDLPECLLHVILSYFDASSLYNISQTCRLFNEMVKRPVFWRFVDARNAPEDPEKFVYCSQQLNERTTHFLYKGKGWNVDILQKPMLHNMSAWCNLKVLALENLYFRNTCLLKDFPNSLEELSLRRSYIENGVHFFRFSSRLERLRVLIVDVCPWFEASCLFPLSQLKNLEILSMYKCKRLSDHHGDYLRLWNLFSLNNIKIIDARYTSLSNWMIAGMYKCLTLQELYFQCYPSTYQLDKMKRKLAIHGGAEREAHAQESEDESNVDTNKQRFYKRFQVVNLHKTRTDVLEDKAISMYQYVKSVDEKPKRPESFLFKYPYAECACGFSPICWANKTCAETRKADSAPFSDDTDDDETKRLKRKIKKRRRQLRTMLRSVHAPVIYAPYNLEGRRGEAAPELAWMRERAPQTQQEMAVLQYFAMERHVHQRHNRHEFCTFVPNSDTESDESSDEEVMENRYNPNDEFQPMWLRRELNGIPRIALNVLCLRGYPKITDESLKHLENVNLHLLDVSYTNVTRRGLIDFIEKHPNCRVVHKSACTCGPRMHF